MPPILGNPGLVDYYIPFLLKLQSTIPPHFALLAHSHIGHSPSLAHPPIPLNLNEQIEAKVEFVRCLQAELNEARRAEETEARPVRLGFIGHSVGSEIIVQTMRHLERSNRDVENLSGSAAVFDMSFDITASFLLFPTVSHIAETPNGRSLRPIFNPPLIQLLPLLCIMIQPLIWTLRTALSILPSSMSFPGLGSIYVPNATTLSFLSSPQTVKSVLHLARSEMSTIKAPDLDWYRQQRKRIWSYWGEPDGWVGTQGDGVKKVLREGKGEGERVEEEHEEHAEQSGRVIDCVDNIPHAFCLGRFCSCRGESRVCAMSADIVGPHGLCSS